MLEVIKIKLAVVGNSAGTGVECKFFILLNIPIYFYFTTNFLILCVKIAEEEILRKMRIDDANPRGKAGKNDGMNEKFLIVP